MSKAYLITCKLSNPVNKNRCKSSKTHLWCMSRGRLYLRVILQHQMRQSQSRTYYTYGIKLGADKHYQTIHHKYSRLMRAIEIQVTPLSELHFSNHWTPNSKDPQVQNYQNHRINNCLKHNSNVEVIHISWYQIRKQF